MRQEMVNFNLEQLMGDSGVTVKGLAAKMGITMKRVHAVCDMTTIPYLNMCDFHQAVTGVNVFSRSRWENWQEKNSPIS